jgi:hypothetical protein
MLSILLLIRGRVSKHVTNGSKTAVMDVIRLLCVSLGSSTDQLRESLGSRRACACSEAGSVVKKVTILEMCTTEEERSIVRFCGQKDSMQRIFIKKCFLFTPEVSVA